MQDQYKSGVPPLDVNKEEIEMLDHKDKNKMNRSIPYPTWKENLSYYFSQYCGATSIHGIQYIGERGRLLIERLLWIIIMSIFWCVCMFFISKTYNKWVSSPVIVTFATSETSISEIPFPAVTVCPMVKDNPKVFNFTDILIKKVFNLSDVSEEENQYFESLSLLFEFYNGTEYGLDEGNLTIDITTLENIINASPYSNDSALLQAYWQQNKDNQVLSEVISNRGLCYSFNILSYSEILNQLDNSDRIHTLKSSGGIKGWSLDEGYLNEDAANTFPRRSFVPGSDAGYVFLAAINRDQVKHSFSTIFSGYEVALHHPSELPNMDKNFLLPLDQVVLVAIKPRMITISENLKSYKPEARKCYLSNERKLKFFRTYTQQNCMQECFINHTWNDCGCRPFYMFVYGSAPICGPGSNTCLRLAKERYISYKNSNECNCLPSCTSLEYDIEISQSDWDFSSYFNLEIKLRTKNLSTEVDFSSLYYSALIVYYVYYKEEQFLTSQRNELYGYVDFFSNMGGLLGLFMGFSVTSLIEIFYFLTLRLVCNIKKFGKRFWSGAPELIEAESVK